MSLILDALRKADAERERGSVPGLRSQPVVPLSETGSVPKPSSRLGWPAIAIGIGVGLALAAVWMFVSRAPEQKTATPASAAPVASAQPLTPPPMPAPTPAPTPAVVDTPPAPSLARPSAPVPASPAAAQEIAEPAPWTRPGERSAVPGAAEPPARARGGATNDLPVYPYDLLPSQVRAALPPLSVSGSIYSADPRGRSLIVNGRLMREGNAVTPELMLEEIRLKSAIFAFRAYRFEVPF